MKTYTINDVKLSAHSYRTAVRRVSGYLRGELDIDGKTILAKNRTPPGRSLKKREVTA